MNGTAIYPSHKVNYTEGRRSEPKEPNFMNVPVKGAGWGLGLGRETPDTCEGKLILIVGLVLGHCFV